VNTISINVIAASALTSVPLKVFPPKRSPELVKRPKKSDQ
jgi:hypothetical protein